MWIQWNKIFVEIFMSMLHGFLPFFQFDIIIVELQTTLLPLQSELFKSDNCSEDAKAGV